MDLIDGFAKKYLRENARRFRRGDYGADDCTTTAGDSQYSGWTIAAAGGASAVVAGRGMVATRDYGEGDVIFVDTPLIVSPRVIVRDRDDGNHPAAVCPVCYAVVASADPAGPSSARCCPGGCRLPVCGQTCADRPEHSDECLYVRRLCPTARAGRTWSAGVYNAIAPVRGLVSAYNGPYKRFLDVLQKKSTTKPVFEVEELKRNIKMKLEEDDEQIMKTICNIMDANCFETITNRNNNLISLKGLYPVAAFMNHCCVPNTMHNFNEHFQMIVKAALPIYKGQEITTTYTHLTWPTFLRQNHLVTSKQFVCACKRCRDPHEFGSELAAVNCTVKNCSGRILPINPLDKTSIWQCKICTKLVSDFEVLPIYKHIKSLMDRINVFCPKSLEAILKTFNIHKDSPYVVDLRLKLIYKSKNSELELEHLLYKEKLCIDVLDLVQKLGLGQCRLLGLVSLELSRVINEKINRFRWNTKTLNIFVDQISRLKTICSNVFDGDFNADLNIKDQ